MDFQKLNRILGDIMFLWVISWGGTLLICKKKKQILKKVKKLGVCISIILLAASFILNIVRSTISFPSLEEAVSFYGKTKQHGQALVGEKTAFVPEFGGMLELNVFDKKNNRWKLPNYFFPNGKSHSECDDNTQKYIAGITWDGDTGNYYVFLWDNTEWNWKHRNVRDTENSNFIYFGPRGEDSWGYGFYYSYLTAVPENYKLYIDDYEITVDWEEIFENRGFRG